MFGFRLDELLKWSLATPVQFWIGWRFHKGAYKALRRGVANMDVLVALGTDASYFYSVISILHHRFVRHDAMQYTPTVSGSCVAPQGLLFNRMRDLCCIMWWYSAASNARVRPALKRRMHITTPVVLLYAVLSGQSAGTIMHELQAGQGQGRGVVLLCVSR